MPGDAGGAELRAVGESEVEGGAAAGARLDPDPAAMVRHHAAAERETDAGAGRFAGGMEALEESEDPRLVLGRNADAVVFDAEVPGARLFRALDADPGRRGSVEFEGVVEEVVEEQLELCFVALHQRQGGGILDPAVQCGAFGFQPGGDAGDEGREIDLGEAPGAVDPRQPQHGVHHRFEAGGARARFAEEPGALLAGAPRGLFGEQIEKNEPPG